MSAIIGDMRKTEGEVVLSGSVAYAAQNPWCVGFYPSASSLLTLTHARILSATVRDNILFSHEYDESFYNLVIEGAYRCYSIQMASNPPFARSLCIEA